MSILRNLFSSLFAILLAVTLAWAAPKFIIDSHNHAGSDQEWVDQTVKVYREHNAMTCVLTSMSEFDRISKAAKQYPDVFIPYGRVRPDDPNAVREIQKFYEAGFYGVKFHSPEKNWDDPKYHQLYRMCEYLGLVMLFHTGISSRSIRAEPNLGSSMRMRPGYLDLIARMCPCAIIQGAHFGNPWYDEAAEVCRWSPNVFFDITGSTLHKLIKLNDLARFQKILWWSSQEGEATQHTLKGGPDAFEHIVFGTDEGPEGLAGNIDRFQQFLEANQVPEKIRENMWGLTMARILSIDPNTKKILVPRPLKPGMRLFDPDKFRSGDYDY
ncbi:MAG TPA: amidohydrolase family protein [Candidatus Glassbacteria bacterium]|nr:amidohydrolase family protein [Candidatus Glassbacteria bacterium]